MLVHKDLGSLPSFSHAVITIGTFDGVHSGHRVILDQLVDEAKKVSGESIVITFDPHPRKVLGKASAELSCIDTLDEKIDSLARTGIDHLVVVPFTREFASISAMEYVEQFLIRYFHPHTIIIGYDHRFGHDREGDHRLLSSLQDRFGYKMIEIPEHVLHDIIISSTKIRHAIREGRIDVANAYLGHDFAFEGVVVEGNKIGRTIGYPTANIRITDPDKIIPGNGVYAVEVMLPDAGEHRYTGMMNIGIRPTVDGTRKVIEVNIFHFDQDIYHQRIRVIVKRYLRGEVKFNGLEALKEQLAKDKRTASDALGTVS